MWLRPQFPGVEVAPIFFLLAGLIHFTASPGFSEVTRTEVGPDTITSIPATANYETLDGPRNATGRIQFYSGPATIPRLGISLFGFVFGAAVGGIAQHPGVAALAPVVGSVAAHYLVRDSWRGGNRLRHGEYLYFYAEGSETGLIFPIEESEREGYFRALSGRRQRVTTPDGKSFVAVPEHVLLDQVGGKTTLKGVFRLPENWPGQETFLSVNLLETSRPLTTRCLDGLSMLGFLK